MSTHEYFHALLNVATTINSNLEPSIILQRITEHTAKTLLCKASILRLLDETGTNLLPHATYGLSDAYINKGPVELADSGVDTETLSGKLTYFRNAFTDVRSQYPAEAKTEGLVSVLSAPLYSSNKVIGILRVYSDVERDFTPSEYDFMQGVASITAVVIKNIQLHKKIQTTHPPSIE